jgi:hypothetical protein
MTPRRRHDSMSVRRVAEAHEHHVGRYGSEELGGRFQECCLADVSTGQLVVHADYDGFDDLFRPFAAGVGHSGACLVSLDGAGQAALAADVHRRLGSPTGTFTLTARAWWARGTAR